MYPKHHRGPKPVTLTQQMQRNFKQAMKALDAAIEVENRQCAVDPEAKEKMRLYLSSWVRGPLHSIIEACQLAEQNAKEESKQLRGTV